jgi:hypothetical protein
MEFQEIYMLLDLLQNAGLFVCIVGELTLNYYKAARIVHVSPSFGQDHYYDSNSNCTAIQDLELCVPEDDLHTATAIFESTGLLEKADEVDHNLYTEYKRGYPRFQICPGAGFYVVLFTDKHCHLDPLQQHIVFQGEIQNAAGYSREIIDSISPDQIASLPFPRLAPFFKGFCSTYIATQEGTAAIAAELLVDGMDVDEEWCHAHLSTLERDELNFALRLVRGKRSRIPDFSSNEVTCFITDYTEAWQLQKVPGFL